MARTVRSSMGSSPLMRGKLLGSLLRLGRHGLIPAHTGKTRACRAEPTSTRAHPRSRGENPPPLEVPKYAMGSSPLMRGKPGRVHGVTERLGLIPTHAGKTWSATERSPSRTAHPRSRGENRESTTQKVPRAGSSPLTRRKRIGNHHLHARAGFIPAHAGKTRTQFPCRSCRTAHPRSRGENRTRGVPGGYFTGSSLLTRGKYFLTYAFIAQIGQTLESPELCVSSESYSSREPVPPATSRNARAASRERSASPHSHQPTRWSIRFQKEQTPPSE